MNHHMLTEMLEAVAKGHISVSQAQERLVDMPMEDIDYAHIDHHRSLRKGFPEVVFGEGKSAEQIAGIMERMQAQEQVILATRTDAQKAALVLERMPGAVYDETARMIIWQNPPLPKSGLGRIAVISAGTSDIPVAREALLTADAMGNNVEAVFDVGVAGIHRLMAHREVLEKARVLIVGGRYGGGFAERGSRYGSTSCYRSADQYRLRRESRRTDSPFRNAQQLQLQHRSGQYRQWIRRRLHGRLHQPTVR